MWGKEEANVLLSYLLKIRFGGNCGHKLQFTLPAMKHKVEGIMLLCLWEVMILEKSETF